MRQFTKPDKSVRAARRPHWLACGLLACLACVVPTQNAPAQGVVDPLGIWSEVTLYRDEWGTPHVYAQNYRALAFGFGYAQAEDHIEVMLLAYRMAQGRAAAVWGEAWADSDAFSLRLGHARMAQQALAAADPLTRDLCEGFALGVNAWLADHAKEVPGWVDGVRPHDVLALWHAYLTSFAPLDLPHQYRRPPAARSGNAWVVGPSKSDSGNTLLSISGQEYYDSPFRWYEAHLVVGDYDMAGATLFGLPIILQGHNASLGWGLTPNQADTADVFEESVEPPTRRRAANDPRLGPAEVYSEAPLLLYYSHTQSYEVRTAAGLETRFTPAFVHSRGPVFEHEGGLFSWTMGAYRAFGGLVQLVEMGRARDVNGFRRALALQQLPCFHVVYGDNGGNLYYLYNALSGTRAIPGELAQLTDQERGRGIDWTRPQSVHRAMFAWGQAIPFTALPQILNPESGYLQATGNPPWLATENSLLDPSAIPYGLVHDTDSFRARRVRQLLGMGRRTFSDMQAMLYDTLMPAAVDFGSRLVASANEEENLAQVHPDLPTVIALLEKWGYHADKDSEAATFYHIWWKTLRESLAEAFPREADLYDALIAGGSRIEAAALEAAANAVRRMRNEMQAVQIPWGEVHRIRRGNREEPFFGARSGDPIFHADDSVYENGRWITNYGYGFAMAIEFGDRPKAASIVPFGASENPQSAHYDDQLDLFLGKRLKRTRYQVDEVLRYAESARGKAITLYPLGVPGAWYFRAPTPINASIDTAVEGPGVLPEGMAAFSLFMTAKLPSSGVPVDQRVEVYVPSTQCADNHLGALMLAQYRPGAGWQPIPGQQLDFGARILSAPVQHEGPVVLLGPEEALETLPEDAPTLVAVAQPAPEVAPPADAPATNEDDSDAYVEPLPPLQTPTAPPAPTGAPQLGDRSFPPGLVFGPGRGDTGSAALPAETPPPQEAAPPSTPPAPGPTSVPATSGPSVPELRDLTPVGKQDETRVFTFRPGEGLKEHTPNE